MCATTGMCWVIEEKDQSWDGDYVRRDSSWQCDSIPEESKDVLDVKETTFLHDKAPYMKAIAIEQLLRANKVDFSTTPNDLALLQI